jgi:cytochrome c peroxidase
MTVLARGLLFGCAVLATFACSSQADSGGSCGVPGVQEADCARAQALLLPAALPAARGNQYADNMDAATLGFHLFFDSSLGSGVACVNCHAPELAFTDRLSVSQGKGTGFRNAPTVFNAARLKVIFWDGRADSVWSQPLFAIENPTEMGSTRLELAHTIADSADYKANYESVFGPMPDTSAWPALGKPGDPAFDALSSDQQDQVNRIAANVGKAFEAYERLNDSSAAPFDLYLGGDSTQIVDAAQRGFSAFLAHKCDTCHSGPMLTDESFHDVGFPAIAGVTDDGRAAGLAVLKANVFNLEGPYADPGPGVPGTLPTDSPAPAEFRTPSLRNVALTPPYGHDGALASLPDVLSLHAPDLSATESGDMLAFFQTLNGEYPPRPWNDWPTPQ